MRKERKHFTPEGKVAILRRHLVDKIPVSELCEELGEALNNKRIVSPEGGSLRGKARAIEAKRYRSGELVAAAGWGSVSLDRATAAVRLRPGTQLDLGATAKAFAADRIVAAIHRETGSAALVSLGGDVAVAGALDGGGWPILVTDDSRDAEATGQVVEIREGGLATSSTTVRRWVAGEVELHHIVDPATGAPAAERWRTVSVAAESCLAANVAATAAIVLGDRAVSWLGAQGAAARLVRPNGAVLAVGGWPLPVQAELVGSPS